MTAREVVVLDVEMGNLRSVARAVERVGGVARTTRDPDVVARAERLIVPGQGQFGDCADALAGELGDAVRAFVATGRPYLGICLGMQVLFDSSEEAPGARGLGIVRGAVRRFPDGMRDATTGERLKVPHVGWSRVVATDPRIAGEWFYFVHSFRCEPADDSAIVATCDHGGSFCAAVARDNVLAVQFHPEKSGEPGHALLQRFVEGSWS